MKRMKRPVKLRIVVRPREGVSQAMSSQGSSSSGQCQRSNRCRR